MMNRRLSLLWPYLALMTLALIATGFWFYGAAQIKKQLGENPDINFQSLAVKGFPSQYRIVLDDMSLRLPQGSIRIEKLTAVRMLYDFNHTIVWAEGPVNFEGRSGDRITLSGESLKASHVLTGKGHDLVRDARISLDFKKPEIRVRPITAKATDIHSDLLQFYSLPTETGDMTLLLKSRQLVFSDAGAAELMNMDRLVIETELPSDPQNNQQMATLNNLLLDINLPTGGRLGVRGSGRLGRNPTGHLDGVLNFNIENLQSLIEVMRANGYLTQDQAALLTLITTLPNQQKPGQQTESGASAKTLPIDLSFRNGRMFLGPVELGRAPRL